MLAFGGCYNDSVFVPFGAVGWAYAIRPYDRVRVIPRNTDTIPQPGTGGPSKNDPVFVPFGADWWAYAIRPYDRVRAILRNTDVLPRLATIAGWGCGAVGATVCGGDGRE